MAMLWGRTSLQSVPLGRKRRLVRKSIQTGGYKINKKQLKLESYLNYVSYYWIVASKKIEGWFPSLFEWVLRQVDLTVWPASSPTTVGQLSGLHQPAQVLSWRDRRLKKSLVAECGRCFSFSCYFSPGNRLEEKKTHMNFSCRKLQVLQAPCLSRSYDRTGPTAAPGAPAALFGRTGGNFDDFGFSAKGVFQRKLGALTFWPTMLASFEAWLFGSTMLAKSLTRLQQSLAVCILSCLVHPMYFEDAPVAPKFFFGGGSGEVRVQTHLDHWRGGKTVEPA